MALLFLLYLGREGATNNNYLVQYALAQVSYVFLSFFCFNFYKVIFIFSLTGQLVICESVWLCLALYDLFNV